MQWYIFLQHAQRPWHLASVLPFISVSLSHSHCYSILQNPMYHRCIYYPALHAVDWIWLPVCGERNDFVELPWPKLCRTQTRQDKECKQRRKDGAESSSDEDSSASAGRLQAWFGLVPLLTNRQPMTEGKWYCCCWDRWGPRIRFGM